MNEHSDKLDPQSKSNLEAALADAKKAIESEDIEAIRSSTQRLTEASHKLAEVMYAQASQAGEGPNVDPGMGAGAGGGAQDRFCCGRSGRCGGCGF